jgi:hypothetical protein
LVGIFSKLFYILFYMKIVIFFYTKGLWLEKSLMKLI